LVFDLALLIAGADKRHSAYQRARRLLDYVVRVRRSIRLEVAVPAPFCQVAYALKISVLPENRWASA
jgi:hypothetical protein